jgi:glutamyl-tRNA synthetase
MEMATHFETILSLLEGADWNPETLAVCLKGYITDNGLKVGDVFRLFRTALVGTDQGPDLVLMMDALGKEESIRRIRTSLGIFNEAISA